MRWRLDQQWRGQASSAAGPVPSVVARKPENMDCNFDQILLTM